MSFQMVQAWFTHYTSESIWYMDTTSTTQKQCGETITNLPHASMGTLNEISKRLPPVAHLLEDSIPRPASNTSLSYCIPINLVNQRYRRRSIQLQPVPTKAQKSWIKDVFPTRETRSKRRNRQVSFIKSQFSLPFTINGINNSAYASSRFHLAITRVPKKLINGLKPPTPRYSSRKFTTSARHALVPRNRIYWRLHITKYLISRRQLPDLPWTDPVYQ